MQTQFAGIFPPRLIDKKIAGNLLVEPFSFFFFGCADPPESDRMTLDADDNKSHESQIELIATT